VSPAARAHDAAELALLVIAKQPLPGLAKTRLAPALGPHGAAAVAEAALADTLAAVAATPARRRVLVLEGEPGEWLPEGFELISQRGDGLASRLAAGFSDAGEPALLVGMDTPQVTPAELVAAGELLCRPEHDAVLGRAEDGGWWALGIHRPDPRVFKGVPMSEPHTGDVQLASLEALGLRVGELPVLRDIDTIGDARAVAALAPGTRFARALAEVDRGGP
jgi:rSAM/selenodomain-associated transferase 1